MHPPEPDPAGPHSRLSRAGRTLIGALLGALPATALAQDEDVTRLPVEQLMDAEVAPSPKDLLGTAAALYVITGEDIRRSGATCIPEALRMAPGVEVARIDSNKWSIAIRGFAGRFSNKLLVLIDGRSVATPLFAGVYWDAQDVLLEDVDRIEVVRGPGAATWSGNAVDGVINVVTKRARDTRGVLVEGGGGSEERAVGSVRVGVALGDRVHVRGYESYVTRDSFASPGFTNAGDAWDVLRGGLRLDWEANRDQVTIQGDVYDGSAGGMVNVPTLVPPYRETQPEDIDLSGANALGRWTRTFAGGSTLAAQAYYDHTHRQDAVVLESRDTFDLDLRHRFSMGESLGLAWGLGFRDSDDDLSGSPRAAFVPDSRHDQIFSAFAQADLALASRRLHVVAGSRFEHNDYTGFEAQPSLRLVFQPGRRWSAWGAVSRAVRTPARSEADMRVPVQAAPGPDGSVALQVLWGSPAFESETAVVYEAGARLDAGRVFLDLALYHGDYDRLRTLEPGTPEAAAPPAGALVPVRVENRGEARSSGAELAAWWRVSARLRLAAAGSVMRLRGSVSTGSLDTSLATTLDDSPDHELHLRSFLDLPGRTSLDVALYQVGRRRDVPAHLRLDARLGFRPSKALEISAGFQDLLEARHAELAPGLLTSPALVERGAYVKVTLRY